MSLWKSFVIGVATLALGCSTVDTPSPKNSDPLQQTQGQALQRLDGRTVFVGVFFGAGPAADRLAEVWNSPDIKLLREAQARMSPEEQAAQLEMAAAQFAKQGSANVAKMLMATAGRVRTGTESPGDDAMKRDVRDAIAAYVQSVDATFFLRFGEDMQSGDNVRVDAALVEGTKLLANAITTLTGSDPTSPDGFVKSLLHHVVSVKVAVAVVVVAVTTALATIEATLAVGGQATTLQHQTFVEMIASHLQVK